MATLPKDVQFYILTKLPEKSISRFKCVSKSWQTLLSSPDFIRLHHQYALSSNMNRYIVFIGNCDTLQLHHLNSSLAPPLVCPFACPQPQSDYRAPCKVKIVASTEFCLLTRCNYSKYNIDCVSLILLNPSTGSYYTLPFDKKPSFGLDASSLHYGICFDEANDDYKVVRIVEYTSEYDFKYKYKFESAFESESGSESGSESESDDMIVQDNMTEREVVIYSLKKNKWKVIETTTVTSDRMRGDIAVSGRLLHTIFRSSDDLTNGKVRIGCFDIIAGQWTHDVPLPPIQSLNGYDLHVLEGSLCVSGSDKGAVAAGTYTTYSVWVMKEYGVHDSWVKLMSIISDKIYRPIAYREGSTHELLCLVGDEFDDLFWYNLRDKEYTRAEFYGVRPGDGDQFCSGHILRGSLVCFPGGSDMYTAADAYNVKVEKSAQTGHRCLKKPRTMNYSCSTS